MPPSEVSQPMHDGASSLSAAETLPATNGYINGASPSSSHEHDPSQLPTDGVPATPSKMTGQKMFSEGPKESASRIAAGLSLEEQVYSPRDVMGTARTDSDRSPCWRVQTSGGQYPYLPRVYPRSKQLTALMVLAERSSRTAHQYVAPPKLCR